MPSQTVTRLLIWTYDYHSLRFASVHVSRPTLCWLLSLLVLVPSAAEAVSAEAPRSQAYFNASIGSSLTLDTQLDMRSQISVSFRTCAYGQLLHQQGEGGHYVRLALTANGSLALSWLGAPGTPDRTVLGARSLRDNHWYTVESRFMQGEIHLSVERGSELLERRLVANSTYRRYVWDLALGGGSGLQVGSGFTGCIMEGPGVVMSAANTNAVNVSWGQCPLETLADRDCAPVEPNPCWTYPCSNGGSCIEQAHNGYACSCPLPYSGVNCETDLGYKGCELEPCQNGGTCEPRDVGTRRYKCRCSDGFTGVNCEIDIDECAPTPCKNGGVCTNHINRYQCACKDTGYTGTSCTVNVNECELLEPCRNSAACMDTPGSYKCECAVGYAGKNCEQGLDECSSNPCRGDATCEDFEGYYTCQCSAGFTGVHCEVDIDDCDGVVCAVAKTSCVDAVNSYFCRCQAGYYSVGAGDDGSASECAEVDECAHEPCQHDGVCDDLVNGYSCRCAVGYAGENCERVIDECVSEPCQNGGSCVDLVGRFLCECTPGYSGDVCDEDIDECRPSPCRNGATCVDKVNHYECLCVDGWTSTLCDEQILECLSKPCSNGATCVDELNGYACLCGRGYSGPLCEVNVDDCAPPPCLNGGTCVDGVNEYTCECDPDYMGVNCSEVYDACSFEPCLNNGSCITASPEHSYECRCVAGYEGVDCRTNIDDCVSVTCQSHLVCVDGINSYSCLCPVGYTGEKCEVDIDECASSPCQNGATCTQGIGNYTCHCLTDSIDLSGYTGHADTIFKLGFEGVHCERDLDECAYRPPICLNKGICTRFNNTFTFKCFCASGGEYFTGKYCEIKKDYCAIAPVPDRPVCQNGGTCKDVGDAYKCTCLPGYIGERCKVNFDECASAPCQHDGECVDGVNGYTCQCQPGLTGVNCEIDIEECSSNPCRHAGRCNELINGYTCDCTDTGFSGVHCENNIDECLSDPCQNNASCVDGVKGYACQCHTGYTGRHCGIDINECESSPCQHGGHCVERSVAKGVKPADAAGYNCQCQPGYTGVHCEIDIDECASSPCVHGACVDAVAGYTCRCAAGYRGDRCAVEIDECAELTPCRPPGRCTDLVADYRCTCVAVRPDAPSYAGRNCSTLLTGCETHKCQNGATCWPTLGEEALGPRAHGFRCECAPGFSGELCRRPTTAAFDRAPGVPTEDWAGGVALRFRTSLLGGVLAAAARHGGGFGLTLRLDAGGGLVAEHGGAAVELRAPENVRLNDTRWHQVELSVSASSRLQVALLHADCPADGRCVASAQVDGQVALQTVYFGGTTAEEDGFTGCLQDMKVDGRYMLPSRFMSAGRAGCPRTQQCEPDPCSARGACTDLWFRFKCDCRRPYYGADCSQALPAVTFGYGGEDSRAMFVVPAAARARLRDVANVSLFFRTRAQSGLLYYLGAAPGAPAATYIAVSLAAGRVSATVWLGDGEPTTVTTGRRLNDGRRHFLRLTRSDASLRLSVDGVLARQAALTTSGALDAERLYVGRLPTPARHRRAAEQTPAGYRGTLQDLRINGMAFHVGAAPPDEAAGVPAGVTSETRENVRSGEVTDAMCAAAAAAGDSLCENNATCYDKFFNDFGCNCTVGFRGKNCSLVDFCYVATCPAEATCNDLLDGYECTAAGTYHGGASYILYTATYDLQAALLTTLSLSLRTRAASATVVHLRSANTNFYLTVELRAGAVVVSYDLDTAEGRVEAAGRVDDGETHSVVVGAAVAGGVVLTVDGVVTRGVDAPAFALDVLLGYVTAGGAPAAYRRNNPHMFAAAANFAGCLSEVRVGGVILPVFSQSAVGNTTAARRFDAREIADVQPGCVGDDVCATHRCDNGATCVDVWNMYTCTCALGFDGDRCGHNIDDCAHDACENGATCVDGVAAYTCHCVAGYTGDRCETDIDDCASDPCRNNGTCTDRVAGYRCNCTANYTGVDCHVSLTDNCDVEPCSSGATCMPVNTTVPGVMSFQCVCAAGFTDRLCDTEIDYCDGSPCRVNSTCVSNRTTLQYDCHCQPGYVGRECQTDVDECASTPCQHGATCSDYVNSYNCSCSKGWEGVHCEQDVDECERNSTCERGACVNQPGSFYCNCSQTGYEGVRCADDIDECVTVAPCLNAAECVNSPGSYRCNCSVGYEGRHCDAPNCSLVACQHNFTCSVPPAATAAHWTCDCAHYYEGSLCEFAGPCVNEPCKNEAVCLQQHDNYTCNCKSGWQGVHCETDIDECETPTLCKEGATCVNLAGSYRCDCVPGRAGRHCADDIDECASSPCQHGSTCEEKDLDFYTCLCQGTGYEGVHCERDVDECAAAVAPCHHDAACDNVPGAFGCRCMLGYVGDTCHSFNPCNASDFCNAGNCSYVVDDVAANVTTACACPDNWGGDYCDTQILAAADAQSAFSKWSWILYVCLAVLALVCFVIVPVIAFRWVSKKRATHGTYSPSRQEMSGSRVEMGNGPKLPPEERLI